MIGVRSAVGLPAREAKKKKQGRDPNRVSAERCSRGTRAQASTSPAGQLHERHSVDEGDGKRLRWLLPLTLGLCSWVSAAARVEASLSSSASSAVALYVSSNAYRLFSQPSSVALPDVALLIATTFTLTALVLTLFRAARPACFALLSELSLLMRKRPSSMEYHKRLHAYDASTSMPRRSVSPPRQQHASWDTALSGATGVHQQSSSIQSEQFSAQAAPTQTRQDDAVELHHHKYDASFEDKPSKVEGDGHAGGRRDLPLEVLLSLGGGLMDRTAQQTSWRSAGRAKRNVKKARGREPDEPFTRSELNQQQRFGKAPQEHRQMSQSEESQRRLPQPRSQPLDAMDQDWEELLQRRREWKERVSNALRQPEQADEPDQAPK